MANTDVRVKLGVADKIRRNNPYKNWREYAPVDTINRKMLHECLSTDILFRVREAKKDIRKFKAHSFMIYARSQAFGQLFEKMMVMRHNGETEIIEPEEKFIYGKNQVNEGRNASDRRMQKSYKYQDEDDPNIRGVAFDIKRGIVDVYDVRPDVFEEILRYLYFQEVDITKGNIYEMIYAAHKFKIYSLTEQCNVYLRGMTDITKQNVLKFLETSLTYNALDMVQICVTFIDSHKDVLEHAKNEDGARAVYC